MADQPAPDLAALEWEALPNDFRNLPRLPRRGQPSRPHGTRPPGTGPPTAGPDWYEAWLTGVKPRCIVR